MVRVTNEPGDADRFAAQSRDGDEGLVVVMVDVREVAELRVGEVPLRGEETGVA